MLSPITTICSLPSSTGCVLAASVATVDDDAAAVLLSCVLSSFSPSIISSRISDVGRLSASFPDTDTLADATAASVLDDSLDDSSTATSLYFVHHVNISAAAVNAAQIDMVLMFILFFIIISSLFVIHTWNVCDYLYCIIGNSKFNPTTATKRD